LNWTITRFVASALRWGRWASPVLFPGRRGCGAGFVLIVPFRSGWEGGSGMPSSGPATHQGVIAAQTNPTRNAYNWVLTTIGIIISFIGCFCRLVMKNAGTSFVLCLFSCYYYERRLQTLALSLY
jgi:hypothetical protein